MDYRDSGHRPHAVHTGETPKNPTTRGPYGITVTLDSWGPVDNLFTTMYDALQSNWGDAPSRTVNRTMWWLAGRDTSCTCGEQDYQDGMGHPKSCALRGRVEDLEREIPKIDQQTGWAFLTEGERAYVESCFAGKTLNQILEMLTFEFTVDGVARVFTHQFVRTRIGAGFMQHGGRDNDWRHRPWTMPETLHRACLADDEAEYDSGAGLRPKTVVDPDTGRTLRHPIADWRPIDRYLASAPEVDTLRDAVTTYLERGRHLYAALVDAGIPWQDARRLLWMGTQTYIHGVYNYLALQGVCNKRLEPIMDWEINAVVQLMVREVRMKCHPLIGKYLQSLSDKIGKDAFAGLESWTPSGKHAVPADKQDLERTHRPEQAPFWILHPDSMAGGPIVWVPTDGQWPEELK